MRNESHFELIEHALNSNFRENARFFPDHLAMHVSWKLIGNKSSRISHQIWCNSAGISDIHLYMNSNFGENARFFPGHLAMHVSRKLIENKSYTFHTQICNSAVISGIANFIWELKAGKFLVSGVLWKTFSHFNLHIYSPMHQCIVFARCELARHQMRWTPPLFWTDFGAIRFSHSKWRRSENICNLLRFSRLSKVRFSNDIGPLAILYGSRNAKNSSTGPSRAMKPETFFFMLPRSTFICNWQRADIPAVLMTDRKQNPN